MIKQMTNEEWAKEFPPQEIDYYPEYYDYKKEYSIENYLELEHVKCNLEMRDDCAYRVVKYESLIFLVTVSSLPNRYC